MTITTDIHIDRLDIDIDVPLYIEVYFVELVKLQTNNIVFVCWFVDKYHVKVHIVAVSNDDLQQIVMEF